MNNLWYWETERKHNLFVEQINVFVANLYFFYRFTYLLLSANRLYLYIKCEIPLGEAIFS